MFIRHAETLKNFRNEFSKVDKEDALTNEGEKQANSLIYFIDNFISSKSLEVKYIYTSASSRSIDTAQIIADRLNLSLKIVDGLTSFDLGKIGGLSEFETERLYPLFFEQLKLYRNGLLNSYAVHYPSDAESPYRFEERVDKGLKFIFDDDNNELKIVILHRSVLTAAYINLARKSYSYPQEFYGFIPIDNGCITLVEMRDHEFKFLFVNAKP